MRTIVTPRGGGKTTKLIRLSAKTGDIIVTIDRRTADYTREMAHQMGLEIPRPATYDEFLNQHWRGLKIKGFLIDDAELLLMRMLERVTETIPIRAMAFSSDRGYGPESPESSYFGATNHATKADL